MRIRIKAPVSIVFEAQAGDEIVVQHLPANLERLLASTRLDGEKVAELVEDEDRQFADAVPAAGKETATTHRRSRG